MAIDSSDAKLSAQAKAAAKTPKLTPAQTAASKKATKIAAAEDAATTAYQTSLTAKPKTAAEQAALSQVASDTAFAILNNLTLPGAARTGVPAQPTASSTWNGSSWETPKGVTGAGVGTTTARAILEMYLRDAGIPQSIMQSSISYLEALDEGGIKDQQTLMDLYMNNKTFTTNTGAVLNSPFYAKYTALGEGAVDPKTGKPYTAKDLFAWRISIEDKTAQYGFSSLFASDESLKKLVKNGVSVDNWETRMQQATLATTVADPAKIAALKRLKFIGASQDAKDFYLNMEIGQKQMEENQRIGAFATEAIRFAGKGINFDEARIRQIAAMYGTQNEAGATKIANELYSQVGQDLQQTVALAGMYDKTGLTAAQESVGVQSELENAYVLGTSADRRNRLAETNANAFAAKSGVGQKALGVSYTAGLV